MDGILSAGSQRQHLANFHQSEVPLPRLIATLFLVASTGRVADRVSPLNRAPTSVCAVGPGKTCALNNPVLPAVAVDDSWLTLLVQPRG